MIESDVFVYVRERDGESGVEDQRHASETIERVVVVRNSERE